MNDFLSDDDIEAANETPSEVFARINTKLADKSAEARKIGELISNLELKLEVAREDQRKILEEDMPALMDEINVSSVTLTNGTMISIDASLHASIKTDNKDAAHQWLKDNGHEDLIKTELNVKFNRSESNMVGEVKGKVQEFGLSYSEKSLVHPMTLKAFVKEQQKSGAQLPSDLFGIFIKRVVNIK